MAGTAYWFGADSGNEGSLATAANFLTDSGTPASPPDTNDDLRFDTRAAFLVTGGATFASVSFESITFDDFRYDFGSSAAPVQIDATLLTINTRNNAWINGDFATVDVQNTALQARTVTFTDGDIANLKVLAGASVVVGALCELSKDAGEFTVVDGGSLTLEANASPVLLLIAYNKARIVTSRTITMMITDGSFTVQGAALVTTAVILPGGTLRANGTGQNGRVILLSGATVTDAANASVGKFTDLIYDRGRSVVNLKSDGASVTNDMPIGLPGGSGGLGA